MEGVTKTTYKNLQILLDTILEYRKEIRLTIWLTEDEFNDKVKAIREMVIEYHNRLDEIAKYLGIDPGFPRLNE